MYEKIIKLSNIFYLSFLSFLLFSCSNTDDVYVKTSKYKSNWASVKLEDYREAFSNENNTKKFITDLKSKFDFVSIYDLKHNLNSLKYTGSKLAMGDSIELPEDLEKILNPDGIIQINNYIIRLDKKKEFVYLLDTTDIKNISLLMEENPSFNKIIILPTDVEVLSLIENTDSLLEKNLNSRTEVIGWFCRDRYAESRRDEQTFNINSGLKFIHKIVYEKYGVYFELKARFDFEGYGSEYYAANMNSYARWSSRCNLAGGNNGTTHNVSNIFKTESKVFYGNAVALKNYRIEAQFSIPSLNYYPAKQIREN